MGLIQTIFGVGGSKNLDELVKIAIKTVERRENN